MLAEGTDLGLQKPELAALGELWKHLGGHLGPAERKPRPGDGGSENLWVDRWERGRDFGFRYNGREVLTNNVHELKDGSEQWDTREGRCRQREQPLQSSEIGVSFRFLPLEYRPLLLCPVIDMELLGDS